MYDARGREEKGKKILAVLSDFLGSELGDLDALDVGCSTGIIDNLLAKSFKMLVGLDIDEEAVKYAMKERSGENEHFLLSDAMTMPFGDQTFDIIVCAHVYEHVPCARTLMSEIHRLLRPNGVCFFAAGNRLTVIEPHYRLPFLSVIPKKFGDLYLRSLGRAPHYYEKHLTYWSLRRLTSGFRVIDYTMDIIANPEKYYAVELCKPGSMKQRFALHVCRMAYWAVPTYVFLLQKV
jgi:SAM-dependent methyltransferase